MSRNGQTVAIIQARMTSTRLPGKILRQLLGRSVLARVVERVKLASNIDGIWIATTAQPTDDVTEAECKALGIPCVRGDEDDVLARYAKAARAADAKAIVRITADCPFIDPIVVDEVVETYRAGRAAHPATEYASNIAERRFPRGLDCEIFSRSALDAAAREATDRAHREHVTPFIRLNPDRFPARSVRSLDDLSGIRITLDTEQDWLIVEELYRLIYRPSRPHFSTADILTALRERPWLLMLNADVRQKHV